MEEVKEGVRPKTAERRDTVKEQHPLSLSRRFYDRTLRGLLYLCAGLTCALLLFLIGYIFYRGLPHITWELVSTQESILNDTTGILPSILNTVYVVVVTMLVVLPLGVGAAVYLTEYASNRRLVAAIEFATETLAGIPSIISVSETALKAVPREYEEASLALGATEIETYFRVSVPAAKSGIAASVVLGIGRAIGEAMAIIMVAGNVSNMPGLFTPVRFLTTGIVSGMAYAAVGSLYQQALYSIALVLFLFIMLINVVLNLFIKKRKEG